MAQKGQTTNRVMEITLEMSNSPLKAESNNYVYMGAEMLANIARRSHVDIISRSAIKVNQRSSEESPSSHRSIPEATQGRPLHTLPPRHGAALVSSV